MTSLFGPFHTSRIGSLPPRFPLYITLYQHVSRYIPSPAPSQHNHSTSALSAMVSSPIHHASLVDPATHSPALLELIDIKMSRPVIEYVVDCVVETVDYAMGRPSSSSSRGRAVTRRPEHAKFTTFVTNVITRAEITTPTVLAALVYIDRAKPHLHIALEEWALERVFLGAIIVASKYLNDSTLKNVHWALCTGVFGKRDVGRIEREYLDVLDFELAVSEADLLSHHQGLAAVTLISHSPRHEQHFSRTHSSSRSHHRNSVPELEPSSPESSLGSSSPRTPSTLASSPAYAPEQKHHHHRRSAPVESQPLPTIKKPSFQETTLELLRSFPIPLPTSTHHSHARTSSQEHSQFPIRVTA